MQTEKEKALELVEEMTMTKKEVAKSTGISTTLLHRIEKGNYKGIEWAGRLAEEARKRGRKLIEMADELQPAQT